MESRTQVKLNFKFLKKKKNSNSNFFFREDFHYDNGKKTGKAVLRGASGAIRQGTKKNGQWHGPATFTSQDGEVKDERWDNGRKM